MKILAVDDDPTILDLLRDCLTPSLGFDLVCADSAEDGLAKIDEHGASFDCFLLDIMLPGVDGITLCDDIRNMQAYKSAPIIMITGSRKHDLMDTAFRAGATDFIFKPLNGIELGARINMAGMLSDSLRREREAAHTLAELSGLMKVRIEESFDLNVVGVDDLHGFENHMLRLPEGCYAMSLFAVKLPQSRNIFEAASPAEFCRQMGLVAQATVAALAHEKCFMGYAGEGIIVGTVMGRHRIKPEEIQKDIEDILSHDGTAARIGGDFSADVTVKLVSNQRLWSGLSACNTLRDFLGRETVPDSTSTDRTDGYTELADGL